MTARVKTVHVIDGNTFVVSPPWHWRRQKGNRVKATGYRCPEMGEPGWETKRSRLEELILHREVELRNLGKIELGFLVCDVYLEGVNIADLFA